MIPTYEPWAEEDYRAELPERLVRCLNCSRLFEEVDGCECHDYDAVGEEEVVGL